MGIETYGWVEYEVDDPVAVIRLNRPEKLNAFTYESLEDLKRAIGRAENDPRVVGIVITGNGRGFCAGLDAQMLATVTSGHGEHRQAPPADEIPGLFTYFLAVPKPIVAAINGVAVGGGLVLASMCDVRFASTAASFATIFLKRGLIAEHGTTWILPRLLGPGRALDLLWTSDRFDAVKAHEMGFVEHLCEPDELLPQARGYIEKIAANAAPRSVAITKRLVYHHLGIGYPEALHETEREQVTAISRPEAKEGAHALLEKRNPRFPRLGEVPEEH
jgi:enoyl-CoA hydratase/carnithine racemase